MSKVQTACGKWHSRSNISKHRKTCRKCALHGSKLERENHELRERLSKLEQRSATVVNINVIVPFSKEPSIDTAEVRKILEPAEDSVPKYVRLKHFIHGGGNLRIPNKNQQRIRVFCENEQGNHMWQTKHKMDFLRELTTKYLGELVDMGAETMSSPWRAWVRHLNQNTHIAEQIRQEEKLALKVMHTVLDAQEQLLE